MQKRKDVICWNADHCDKGFCTHRIIHKENGQCRVEPYYSNCPNCIEVDINDYYKKREAGQAKPDERAVGTASVHQGGSTPPSSGPETPPPRTIAEALGPKIQQTPMPIDKIIGCGVYKFEVDVKPETPGGSDEKHVHEPFEEHQDEGVLLQWCKCGAMRKYYYGSISPTTSEWFEKRTPTHGPCCTCQACGQALEDCICKQDYYNIKKVKKCPS